MPEKPAALSYNEPTVMWRMERGESQMAHAVITSTRRGVVVMWFINSHLLGMREFADCGDAIAWSDQMRNQNWTVGWRFPPDEED